jgi:hypothetical protein
VGAYRSRVLLDEAETRADDLGGFDLDADGYKSLDSRSSVRGAGLLPCGQQTICRAICQYSYPETGIPVSLP